MSLQKNIFINEQFAQSINVERDDAPVKLFNHLEAAICKS